MWKRLKMTMRNRVFLLLVAIVFATVMGFNLVNNFANYITIFYLFGGDKTEASQLMGWIGTAWGVTAVVFVFPLNFISTRVGKTRTLLLAIGLMLGAQASKVVCYDPDHPWLLLIPTVMLSGRHAHVLHPRQRHGRGRLRRGRARDRDGAARAPTTPSSGGS
jgi:GPH family glycoside/pentoside/hexuronide:cation symporter